MSVDLARPVAATRPARAKPRLYYTLRPPRRIAPTPPTGPPRDRRPEPAMTNLLRRYPPGTRVRVTQQTPRMRGVWTNTVEGTVLRAGQAKTGSWFAHARDDRLWLDRLELRLDDGEEVVVNLDQYSRIETIGEPASAPPAA
ncbi:MAG: hypothetical protein D6693_07665 [Planctomycetota bacterium]|nr:MAG: hypothetical protein D6693_07665 [Planctomycetota bacterium]